MSEPVARLPFLLREAVVSGEVRTAELLMTLALKVEASAKVHAGEGGSHPYGEKTDATPGSGPAVVSGDLRRSITHEKVADGIRVGPASIPHTNYQGRSKVARRRKMSGGTDSGKIGRYLETGLRNGAKYPFLGPAFDETLAEADEAARVAFRGQMWT